MIINTISIGGGNKFSLFYLPSFEKIIIFLLKRNNKSLHYHIGHLPLVRLILIKTLLLINGISLKRFKYLGQTKNLNFLKSNKNSIVISSLPFVGALTILECWSLGIPVLIYKSKYFYINFESFLNDKKLQYENLNDIDQILNFAEKNGNFQKLVFETKKYYSFLQNNSNNTSKYLIKNAEKIYSNNTEILKIFDLNLFLRIFTVFFKFFYIIIKFFVILYSNYIGFSDKE
tara:strand:- start:1005 stop:1697 length:693 start_codon:yes stop_codon:yes gene_type:complete